MMYTKAEVWYRNANQQEDAHRCVDGQVPTESALESQIPDLPQCDDENQNNNDGKRKCCAWLLLQVVRRETLDRDEVESVIVQRSNPSAPKPQDRLLNLGG